MFLFQLEKMVISEIHHQPVTALEWSLNGMNLFSGDLEGLVVHTRLDFTGAHHVIIYLLVYTCMSIPFTSYFI